MEGERKTKDDFFPNSLMHAQWLRSRAICHQFPGFFLLILPGCHWYPGFFFKACNTFGTCNAVWRLGWQHCCDHYQSVFLLHVLS